VHRDILNQKKNTEKTWPKKSNKRHITVMFSSYFLVVPLQEEALIIAKLGYFILFPLIDHVSCAPSQPLILPWSWADVGLSPHSMRQVLGVEITWEPNVRYQYSGGHSCTAMSNVEPIIILATRLYLRHRNC